MATKITSKNIDTLKVGDTVAKYPITGGPSEKFDESDSKQIIIMEVGKIDHSTIDLVFDLPKGTEIAGMTVAMGPLHKSKQGMIEDNNWWLISTETTH